MDLFAELEQKQAAPAVPPPVAPVAAAPAADLFAELESAAAPTPARQTSDGGTWMDDAWDAIKGHASNVAGYNPYKMIYDVATGNAAENPMVGRAMSGMQGVTMGSADEILGGLGAAVGSAINTASGDDADIWNQYRRYRDIARSVQGKYAKEHPLQSAMYEFGGAVAGPGKVFAAASMPATGLGRLAAGVGLGAAEGGVAGAGYADEMSDVPGNAAAGAAFGGMAAAAMPLVAPVVSGMGQMTGAMAAGLRRLALETPDEQARRLILDRIGGENADATMAAMRTLNGQGMLADTSMEARRMLRGLQAEYPDANITSPVTAALNQRQQGMVQRLRGNFNRATWEDPNATLPSFSDMQSKWRLSQQFDTKPLYQEVDAATVDLTDDALSVLGTRDGRRAYENASRIAEANGNRLPPLDAVLQGNVTQLDGRTVDYIKQGLDTAVEAARNEKSGTMERAMRGLTNRWLEFADEAIPTYATARGTHGRWQSRRDALDLGSTLMNSPLPAFREAEEQLVNKVRSLGLPEKETADAIETLRADIQQGAYYSVQNRLGTLRQTGDPAKTLLNTEDAVEKLRYAFDEVNDTDYEKFLGDIARESEYAATRQMVTGGSPTQYIDAERAALQRAGSIGNVAMSSLNSPLSAAGATTLEVVRGLLGRRVSPETAEKIAADLTKSGWKAEELDAYLRGERVSKKFSKLMNRYNVTGGFISSGAGLLQPDH